MDEDHFYLDDILGKLKEKGLYPGTSVEECLTFLWTQYQGNLSMLQAARNQLEELRQQQAEEMKEVESYVAHIRSLTEEREALTTDFEKENIQLRAELEKLQDEQESQLKEVEEMLDQEGLNDIAHSSPSEQIAYLLVERATLLEKLETLENRMDIHFESQSNKNRQDNLEQIHQTLEEELYQQRETMKHTKETLTRTFDEELSKEKKQRECAERDLGEAAQRLQMAHDEIRKLTDELLVKKKEITELEHILVKKQQENDDLQKEIKTMRENDSMEVQKAKNYNSRLDKEILALRIRVKLLDSDRKKCTEQSEKSESEFSEKSPPDLEKEAQYNQLLHKRCQLVIEEKDCLNKELQFKLQKLQKELDEIVERNEELESILGDAQNKTKEKISCLECEIEGFQKIVINLETELSELRQFKDVPGIVQEEETHIKTAKDLRKISNLTQEKAAIDMTKEKGDICQQYQEKIKILEHEKETMRLALAEKAKQFEILQKKINEGMEEKQKLWEEIIQLQQDLSNTRQELQAKREENSRMKHDIMNRPERMPRPQICADGAEEMVPNLLAGEALIQQQYEEIRQLRQDLHRAQNLCSSAEKELRYERDKNLNVKKQHICLEQANTMVTAELHQVKQKLANVTAACSKLEVELEKKQQGVKEMELDILKQNQTFKLNSNYQEKLENEKCRATEAEKKVSELQQQLRASRHQLQLLETQVAERRNIEEELKKTRDNEAKFRTQIQEEQLKRKVLEESCKELKHEMFLLRDKEATWMENNSALQFKINQQESRLRSLDDEQSASVRERMYREGANQKLTEDLLQAQQEKEELHKAYDNISKQLDECIRKYNEKQLRYKAKLDRAKEVHIHEVNQHNLRIKQLEMEITLIRSQTEKEQQWISKVITENEHLNEEKRHLLQKIQEHETTERNHKWELLSAQNRAHMLDEENQHLQESLLKLYNQVGSLDRVLRKIQALNVEEITNIIPSEIHIPQLQNKSIPIAGVFSSSGTLKDTSSTQLQEPADSIQSLSVSISHTSDIGYLNVSSPGAEPTSAEQTQSLELSIEKVHI